MPQTTIQKLVSIKNGSTLLEIGDTLLTLVNIGAVRDVEVESLVGNYKVQFDNTAAIKRFNKGDQVVARFKMAEIDMANLEMVDDGLVNLTTTPAAPVAGATYVINSPFVANQDYLITHQNGDLTKPTITSVVGSVDGALTEDDDFYIVKDSDTGKWSIVMATVLAGSHLTTLAQTITLTYGYTPSASKNLTYNEYGTKTTKFVVLTNTDENGNDYIITISGATNMKPITQAFPSDESEDVMLVEVEMEGYVDTIVDEQSTV